MIKFHFTQDKLRKSVDTGEVWLSFRGTYRGNIKIRFLNKSYSNNESNWIFPGV